MRSFITVLALLAPLLAIASPIDSDLLEKRQTACAPLEAYHWAGTSESGLGSVGAPLARDLANAVPGSRTTGVQYDTSAEYVRSVQTAASAGSSMIAARAAACPNTKFALSGYSKGALVVHSIRLSADVQARVTGIALFGDPANRGGNQATPINNKACVFSYCNEGDIFCSSRPVSIIPHLAYARDGSTTKAANGTGGCYRR